MKTSHVDTLEWRDTKAMREMAIKDNDDSIMQKEYLRCFDMTRKTNKTILTLKILYFF